MWYINSMDYYSALKGNEILTHATKRMNLKNIMLTERSSQKRPHIVGFHLYEICRMGKCIETEIKSVVA